MTFDKILDDGRLWAVRYDGKEDNCFEELFDQWYDMNWLRNFFKENLSDLESFFHITDVYEAVMVKDVCDQNRIWRICRNGRSNQIDCHNVREEPHIR